MAHYPDIDFEQVKAKCARWSKRSISVARALIVDGRPIGDVADDYDMTKQQANVIRTRFYSKAEQIRLETFRQRQRPAKATTEAIEPFANEVMKLHREGYTSAQLVDYLDGVGLTVSPTLVSKFLRERDA